jgi:hypothetical protein
MASQWASATSAAVKVWVVNISNILGASGSG